MFTFKYWHCLMTACILVFCCSFFSAQKRPTLYLIGDSTVKNGVGRGDHGLWGWGSCLSEYFDTSRIRIENDAMGGTSSRTFLTKGLWSKVLNKLQEGDYLIMQFGHNDSGPLDDTSRARGTIKGIGNETKEIFNPITKQNETVHTYGWYLRKFVEEAKAKKVTVIICSPVPRNMWISDRIKRVDDTYGKWAKQTAASTSVYFIDLNKLIADSLDEGGPEQAKAYFTDIDHTHTNRAGAEFNTTSLVGGLRSLQGCSLINYLR